jgi:hypothetical protein
MLDEKQTFHPYGAMKSSKHLVYKHFTPLGFFLSLMAVTRRVGTSKRFCTPNDGF